MSKKSVLIGMSGGVDSSVAAYLLKEQGYDVIGAFMRLFDVEDEHKAKLETNINDARRVCEKLEIPFHVLDFRATFKDNVVDYFTEEYLSGRTPNPCAICNKKIKFGQLLEAAKKLGAEYIATGHYSTVSYDDASGRYILKRAESEAKDQSYMFFSLSQDQLKHIIMPLGVVGDKEKVRTIAESIGLDVARKSDSQEICFIPDDDYIAFLEENVSNKIRKGTFKDKEGNILGEHKGIVKYTIGQRKGLGITFGKPTYVIDIDGDKNEIILGDNEDVFGKGLIAKDANFIPFEKLDAPMACFAKIRYNAKPAPCTVRQIDDQHIEVLFEKKERAITNGQAVVLYKDDMLLGGGMIEKRL